MTFIPTTSATTAATAAAAAQRRRRLQREEEQMTRYQTDELEGWEFKIVRAVTRKFRRSEVIQQVCEEEARAGWELVEKFDDYRLRFKRPVERRADDPHLDVDPYRTQIGISGNQLEWSIAGGVILGLGALALVAFLVYSLMR
jgi:hypothetical protein